MNIIYKNILFIWVIRTRRDKIILKIKLLFNRIKKLIINYYIFDDLVKIANRYIILCLLVHY